MGTRIDQQPQGFAAIDPRWTKDGLRANDGAAGNSDYTEASPEPGQMAVAATNNLGQLEVSGGQSRTVDAIAGKGGDAEFEGAGILWRLDGETADTDYRGWNAPNFPTWWEPLTSVELASGVRSLSVIPSTQEPVAMLGGFFYRFDNATQEWVATAASLLTAAADARDLLVMPGSERIVLVAKGANTIAAHASDDRGLTWNELTVQSTADMPVDATSGGADISNGEICLALRGTDGRVYQYGSRNGGVSWSFVGVTTSGFFDSVPQVRGLPGGGFAVSVVSVSVPELRILGSAFDPFDDADSILPHPTLTGVSNAAHAVWPDPDGVLWSLAQSSEGVALAVSEDGLTWRAMDAGLADFQTTADTVDNFKVHACMGGAVMLHQWTANVNTSRGEGVWFVGGWSKAEASSTPQDITTRRSFGDSASAAWSHTWLPIELPDDMAGWSQVGATAGVLNYRLPAVNGSLIDMSITTAATDGSYQLAGLGAGGPVVAICGQFQVITGGSLTSAQIGLGTRWADGSSDYRVRINATPTGFAVRDFHAASTLASVTITDWNLNSVAVLVVHHAASVQVWYRLPGIGTQWVHVISSSSITDGGALAATSLLYFGHLVSSAAESFWHSVHTLHYTGPGSLLFGEGVDAAVGVDSVGRWLTAGPVPAPEIGTDSQVAFLSLTRGPVARSEPMVIEPSHRHPVDHLFPTISASPDDEWRTTDDTTDARVALDFTRGTMLDGSWAYVLALVNTNVRTAKLEGWDGAAWVTLGTYNGSTGFESLGYSLTGNILRPSAGTADADRFLQALEMVGGYAILDPTGTPKVRKIAYHTGGGWTGSGTTTAKPWLRLEGIDGTELATGDVHLVAPSGCLFVYLDSLPASHYERFSLLIEAASNDTAEGYFKVGAAPLGAVTVVGQQWGRGWSRAMLPNTISRTDAHGTTRKRQEGPLPRRWTMSWQSGLNVRQLRQGVNQPYLSAEVAGVPLAADQDVWWQLYGLLEAAKSGQVPVVACARFPTASGTTLTDRTGWLYGTLTGTVQANNVTGQELSGEAMRVESVTVEELV